MTGLERRRRQAAVMGGLVAVALSLLIVGAAVAGQGQMPSDWPARAVPSAKAPGSLGGDANCRYGVAALDDSQVDWVGDVLAGWYLNFGSDSVPASNAAEFVAVITVRQNKTAEGEYLPSYTVAPPLTPTHLGALVASRPGRLWLVGNEVDRGPNPGETQSVQGDTFPDVYARAYNEVYHFIKQYDPTALVAVSGLVQVTPGRLQYLDLFWQAHLDEFGSAPPVDVWNMHVYILPEVNAQGEPNGIANVALGTDPALAKSESYDPDGAGPLTHADTCPLESVYCFAEHDNLGVFGQQITAMRAWMKAHGQREKPLILSEFSLLLPYQVDGGSCYIQDEFGQCFTPERVEAFLNASFDLLEGMIDPGLGYPLDSNRLVQQWLWFSVSHVGKPGDISDLITLSPPGLSPIGSAFAQYVAARPASINLVPAGLSTPAVNAPNGTADVPLEAWVANSGNRTPSVDFTVGFYADESLSELIGQEVIDAPSPAEPGMTGCGTRRLKVGATWTGLTPGLHRYWVKVDSGSAVGEGPYEGDNVAEGFVLVNPDQLLLPAVVR
ncbi:MAG: hypothetical protein ACRDHL_13045 [Candidatus Promineifilaceae bacterium]